MTADFLHRRTDGPLSAETVVEFDVPYDLPRTLGILQRGHGDPAVRVDRGTFDGGSRGTPGSGAWLCQRIYDHTGRELGQVTYRFDQLSSSAVKVRVAASSEQSLEAAIARAPQILGAEDDWTPFTQLLDVLAHPPSPETETDEKVSAARVPAAQSSAPKTSTDRVAGELIQIRRRNPGLRLPATGALFDQLITTTLEQKVTHEQARHSWRNLLRKYGQPPASSSSVPAPDWMRLPLSAEQLRRVPSWSWHKLWVQPPLAATVQRLAERAPAVHRLSASTPVSTAEVSKLAQQLRTIRGIGAWTAAEALQRSHGAADLVAVGDYHLAHFVGEALTGRRTDDAGMVELLAPYRPHRQRVIRLLGMSGARMSRFGPRLAPEDHRER